MIYLSMGYKVHSDPAPVYYRRLFLGVSFSPLASSFMFWPRRVLNSSVHHSGHIKQKWLGPAFRVAESVEGNNGGQKCILLAGSQVTLMLLMCGPYSENH